MATLEIELNCMCLLVADPHPGQEVGAVHVLMPCTHHNGSRDRHIVQMIYVGTDGKRAYRRMEGWALELGTRPGSADTSLQPRQPAAKAGKIADLTAITRTRDREDGCKVPREMFEVPEDQAAQPGTGAHRDVVSRITFYSGAVTAVIAHDQEEWMLANERAKLANQVIWRMDVQPGEMIWTALDPAKERRPLPSLEKVEPSQGVLRIEVHHVAAKAVKALRRNGDGQTDGDSETDGAVLTTAEVRRHFKMFYALLSPEPYRKSLPWLPPADDRAEDDEDDEIGGWGDWACRTAQAQAMR